MCSKQNITLQLCLISYHYFSNFHQFHFTSSDKKAVNLIALQIYSPFPIHCHYYSKLEPDTMGTIHNVLWKFRYLNIYQQISDITFPNVSKRYSHYYSFYCIIQTEYFRSDYDFRKSIIAKLSPVSVEAQLSWAEMDMQFKSYLKSAFQGL